MTNQLKIVVNGKSFDVEVDDILASPIEVTVNGTAYSVDVERDEPVTPQSKIVPKAVKDDMPIMTKAPVSASAVTATPPSGGESVIIAPMPGIIRSVDVKPGQKVAVGEQVCSLEAMKMINAIRSTREGVIASIDVSEGQRVAYGEVIVRFQ